MREGWNVIIRYDEPFATTNIWFVKQNADGSQVVVQPVNLMMTTALAPNVTLPPEPTLRFTREAASQFLQGLTEALIEAGFRPDELQAHQKELEAIKYHLEDMRKLVFEALLPPVPIARIEEVRTNEE